MAMEIVANIAKRWPTADLFYAERDHRTKLAIAVLERYAQIPIELLIDPEYSDSPSIQLMALLTANLTARWARLVRVRVVHTLIHPNLERYEGSLLGDRIMSEMRAADPFGSFELADPSGPAFPNSLRLFIGPWRNKKDEITEQDFVVHATRGSVIGQRGCGLQFDTSQDSTVAAAGLAAAIGAGDLFKRAIKHPTAHWIPSFCWNLGSHRVTLPENTNSIDADNIEIVGVNNQIDLGNILIAGVGAIGSALIYLLDAMRLEGALTLLDRDHVELSNLNRSPLFDVRHVLNDEFKTTAASDYLRAHSITVNRINNAWREKADSLWDTSWDAWISFTNEDSAWAELPFSLTPVVLQGTTTSGWGIGAGRHIPREEDCTLCRMPRPEAEFRGPCSEGEIDVSQSGTEIRASLPFLSTAAAALVLTELQRLASGATPGTPNDISADFRYGLPAVLATKRRYNPNCRGCRAADIPLWTTRGGAGRFGVLSGDHRI